MRPAAGVHALLLAGDALLQEDIRHHLCVQRAAKLVRAVDSPATEIAHARTHTHTSQRSGQLEHAEQLNTHPTT